MQRKRSATIAIGQKRGVNIVKVVQTRLGESQPPMLRLCVMDGGLYRALIGRGTAQNFRHIASATNAGERYRISMRMLTAQPAEQRWIRTVTKKRGMTMTKKYIEREAAKRAFFKGHEFVYYGTDVYERLDDIPAADVVPVVRCKDCKHSEQWYADKSRCFLWHESGIDVFNDGFCNYGEVNERQYWRCVGTSHRKIPRSSSRGSG
jgi:hypothetical protein